MSLVPFIAAAVFAADSSIDFRKLSQSHYDQLSQRHFDEFEKKARSGQLQMAVDLALDQERHHLNTLRLSADTLPTGIANSRHDRTLAVSPPVSG